MKVLCRYILAFMGALGSMNMYFCRINLSVAMVAMVGVTNSSVSENNTSEQCTNRGGDDEEASAVSEGEFDWSIADQGLLTASYYYSYTAGQIPLAWLTTKFGFRKVYGFSMLISCLITFLFPIAAKTDFYMAVAARVALGVFHAVSSPAMQGAWGAWAPPEEKTKLNGLSQSGSSVGTFLIFTIAGYVADYLGWEAVFYVTGASTLVWVVLWFYLVYDTPAEHPRIAKEEREHIELSIGCGNIDRKNLSVPWCDMLTSLPIWGVVLGHTASNWGNYTLNQQLPTYLTNVLHYNLAFTGILSSMCYLLQWLMCIVSSWLTDYIRSAGWMSTIHIRKLNTMIGLWVTGACVVLAGYAGCNGTLTVTLFILSAGLNSFTVSGCKSGMLDMAPAFSGLAWAISNTVANIPGFVAPQLVGFILTDYSVISEWRTVFWVSCGVHVVGSLLYLARGSDQVQGWADVSNTEEQENKATGSEGKTNPGFYRSLEFGQEFSENKKTGMDKESLSAL